MNYHTMHTVRILYFSYMIDTQTNLFNVVFLVGGGIALCSTGAALAVLNSQTSYFSSQYLNRTPGYYYITTIFAGSLIAVFFLVRWYMSCIYSFIENCYCFNCSCSQMIIILSTTTIPVKL